MKSLPNEPYVGPRPFDRNDGPIFFARDREAHELLSLITAHEVVLLYARSGAGKSSLLNAKLIPLLEQDGFQVLPVARLRSASEVVPILDSTINVYLRNLSLALSDSLADQATTGASLQEILSSTDRNPAKPTDAPRVLVIDQFEELFTSYPDRWQQRGELVEELGKCLTRARRLRLVLVMREDYIAELDPYAVLLPDRLRTRFRLEPLREAGALLAVAQPLRVWGYSFEQGAAEELVRGLLRVSLDNPDYSAQGEFVEPVTLQVVCRDLWKRLEREGTRIVTLDQLRRFGDVDQALSEFYERTLSAAHLATAVPTVRIRRWFEQQLITPAKTRASVFKGSDSAAGLPIAVLDVMEREHLIASEQRGRARWCELTHDRLIEPILESNRKALLSLSSREQMLEWLERAADEWAGTGREFTKLLPSTALAEAERLAETEAGGEHDFSERVVAYIGASRAAASEAAHRLEVERTHALAAEQERRANAERDRNRYLKGGLWATSVLFSALLVSVLWAQVEARRASTAVRAAKLSERAATAALQGNFESAERDWKAVLRARTLGDWKGRADALMSLGEVYAGSGRLEEARTALEQALTLYRQGDILGLVRANSVCQPRPFSAGSLRSGSSSQPGGNCDLSQRRRLV